MTRPFEKKGRVFLFSKELQYVEIDGKKEEQYENLRRIESQRIACTADR